MRHLRSHSPDRWVVALTATGAALGAIAIVAHPASDVRVWLPDVVVGAVFVVAGALATGRRRAVGVLLIATGDAWFVDTLASAFVFLHRGPLVHLLLAFPRWWPVGRLQRFVIALGYLAALFWPLWADTRIAIALAASIALAALGPGSHAGRSNAARVVSGVAALVFASAVVSCAIALQVVDLGLREAVIHAYELALAGIASFSVAGAVTRRNQIPDLVVDLGESRSTSLRDAFADAVGDPTLQLAQWSPTAGAYLTSTGAELQLPDDAERIATFVARGDERLAVLVHDASVLDEAGLVEAIASTTHLWTTNSALADDLRIRIDELEASRRRLVVAEDRARRRIQGRLEAGSIRRIGDLERRIVATLDRACSNHDDLGRAAEHLEHTRQDLERIGRGLHPRELELGLCAALRSLATGCHVPVELVVAGAADDPVPPEAAAVIYFVCAEALANAAKHARAEAVTVRLEHAERAVRVEISDDGCGGADPSGSGLSGLADRVAAFGGRLELTSHATGTTVSACLSFGRCGP